MVVGEGERPSKGVSDGHIRVSNGDPLAGVVGEGERPEKEEGRQLRTGSYG